MVYLFSQHSRANVDKVLICISTLLAVAIFWCRSQGVFHIEFDRWFDVKLKRPSNCLSLKQVYSDLRSLDSTWEQKFFPPESQWVLICTGYAFWGSWLLCALWKPCFSRVQVAKVHTLMQQLLNQGFQNADGKLTYLSYILPCSDDCSFTLKMNRSTQCMFFMLF